jgi:DNA polymerase I-like protein with 3'-5' exonuclease and polymerase domains
MDGYEINFIASEEAFYKTIEPLLKLKLVNPIGFDIETSGLDCFNDKIILIQFCVENKVYIYDVRNLKDNLIKYVLSLLESKTIIGHNIKFDVKFIFKNYGIMFKNLYDTMLSETVINAGIGVLSENTGRQKHKAFYSLDSLVTKYANGTGVDKELQTIFENNYDIQITPEIIDYCTRDVTFLQTIYDAQKKLIDKRRISNTINLEMQLLPATIQMEYEGILLDVNKWNELSKVAEEHAAEILNTINEYIYGDLITRMEDKPKKFTNAKVVLDYYKISYKDTKKNIKLLEETIEPSKIMDAFRDNFNPDSPMQMKKILHLLGISAETTSSKELKLNFGQHPFIKLLLEYREWRKKITSFGDNFIEKINPKTGKLHAEFHQGGTATGRFASFNPNLQNILKTSSYRECFIAPEEWDILSADYSQIELVIAAEASQDEIMLDAFRNNVSLHTITAASIHKVAQKDLTIEQYTKGKSMNFAMLYGSSPKGIAYNFQVPIEEAYKYIDSFTETYPQLMAFRNGIHKEVLSRGYSTTLMGRKRWFVVPISWKKSDWKYIYEICREGFSHVIQGSSADITKIAMKDIYYENPFGELLKLILTVHDEIVYCVRKDVTQDAEKFIREHMIMAARHFIKTVPVKVDVVIAPYWTKEKKDVEDE